MKLKLSALLLTLLIPLGLSSPAFAGHHEKEEASDPIAAAAEFPLLLRRTTLIVRDIEASLKLYRDGLGMEVIYDQEINRPHSSEDREQRLRLIFLKASHDYVGVIGLIDYEYGYPDHPAHTKPVRRSNSGNSAAAAIGSLASSFSWCPAKAGEDKPRGINRVNSRPVNFSFIDAFSGDIFI